MEFNKRRQRHKRFYFDGGRATDVSFKTNPDDQWSRTSKGVLIFATYYNSNEIKKLTYVMNLPMSIETIGSWEKENNIQNSTLSASYIIPVNQQYITGYDIIDDINGQPILAVGATMPRTVYDQGLATVSYIDQVLLVAGIIFSAIIVLLLEFAVLRRLGKLTNIAE